MLRAIFISCCIPPGGRRDDTVPRVPSGNFPVRYIAYGWPAKGEKGDPILEEFNYTNIELNVGLTDLDFDPANPNYKFRGVGSPAAKVDEKEIARKRAEEESKGQR